MHLTAKNHLEPVEAVQFWRAQGVDPDIRDKAGKRAVDYVKKKSKAFRKAFTD